MINLNNQRGNLLILTMAVVAFVSLAASTGLYISYNTKTDNLITLARIQAYYIADAGIELALTNLQQDADWRPDAKFKTAFAHGTIESLEIITLANSEDHIEVKITSKGVYRQTQKTLMVTAQIARQEDGQVTVKITSWKELYPVFV